MDSIQNVAMLILGLAVLAVIGMFFFQGIDGVSVKGNLVEMTNTLFNFEGWSFNARNS